MNTTEFFVADVLLEKQDGNRIVVRYAEKSEPTFGDYSFYVEGQKIIIRGVA